MALVEMLSILERALGLLTSNPGPLQRVGDIPSLIYTLHTLSTETAATEGASGDDGWPQTALKAGLALTPFAAGGSSMPPASILSFTPLGALAGLFSSPEQAAAPLTQRKESIAGLGGEPREMGIDSESNFGYTIDRNSNGSSRIIEPFQPRVPTQITVNVQTIDSRSFLDHSEDIAHALRRSLLTDNPLREIL